MIFELYHKMAHIHGDHYDYKTYPGSGRLTTRKRGILLLIKNLQEIAETMNDDVEDDLDDDFEEEYGPLHEDVRLSRRKDK